jgi:septal ring factor EnvC (AmiA/AmiB activator)
MFFTAVLSIGTVVLAIATIELHLSADNLRRVTDRLASPAREQPLTQSFDAKENVRLSADLARSVQDTINSFKNDIIAIQKEQLKLAKDIEAQNAQNTALTKAIRDDSSAIEKHFNDQQNATNDILRQLTAIVKQSLDTQTRLLTDQTDITRRPPKPHRE